MDNDISRSIVKVKECIDQASVGLVERKHILEILFLGLITGEHLLMIGPPGTAKSLVVQRAASAIDASYFEYLIGRFTEPNELFGSLDLVALKNGVVEPVTTNMLPEAEIAFLDEIFLGSTAILNTLLGILNERSFKRGPLKRTVPLRSCVSASNHMPDDPMLSAFADRFLFTVFLEPVQDEHMNAMLEGGWNAELETKREMPRQVISLTEIDQLRQAAKHINLTEIRDLYAHFIRKIRVLGIPLSDRRIVKAQKVLAAAALLRGATTATAEDLWPIVFLVQDAEKQAEVRDLLHEELKNSNNPVMTASVSKAGYGPTAHAQYLVERGEALLAERPKLASDPSFEIWLVRIETLIMNIDAAFAEESLPQNLRIVRTALVGHLDQKQNKTAIDNDSDMNDSSTDPSAPADSETAAEAL